MQAERFTALCEYIRAHCSKESADVIINLITHDCRRSVIVISKQIKNRTQEYKSIIDGNKPISDFMSNMEIGVPAFFSDMDKLSIFKSVSTALRNINGLMFNVRGCYTTKGRPEKTFVVTRLR